MHTTNYLLSLSLKRTFMVLMGTLSMVPLWSQDNTITVEGPYYLENAKSLHQTITESNPVTVARSPELIAKMNSNRNPCSTINANYTGFSADAITAFEFAMAIWENSIESTIPITVSAEFISLPNDVTAAAEPNGYFTISGAGLADTLYPKALAEALSGSELGGANSTDILISINDGINFYYGLDANPPTGQIDFVTLILHNLGHGLGFIGFGITDGTTGSIRDGVNGLPSIFDRFIENNSGTAILSFTDPSTDLHAQLTSDNLFVDGTNANSANSGNRPKIYSPTTFDFFKSYDHWDSAVFPPSNPNSLMTETLAPGQANHNPGEVTLGFFADLGWVLCETLSNETIQNAEFKIIENPVQDQLTVQFSSSVSGYTLGAVIYDFGGKVVYEAEREIDTNQLVISNLSTWPSGVYFLTLNDISNGSTITRKFIKN